MGASVNGVILLPPAEFVKLALIANVIARPTAYAVMQRWLQTFAYQVNPASEYVYFQASLPLMITLLTVSYHAIKTALSNPVDALRTK